MKTLTIQLTEKTKQVIKLTDKFSEGRTYGEQSTIAKSIAHSISNGNYLSFELNE